MPSRGSWHFSYPHVRIPIVLPFDSRWLGVSKYRAFWLGRHSTLNLTLDRDPASRRCVVVNLWDSLGSWQFDKIPKKQGAQKSFFANWGRDSKREFSTPSLDLGARLGCGTPKVDSPNNLFLLPTRLSLRGSHSTILANSKRHMPIFAKN